MAASFGAISLLGVVATADWYFNHKLSQSIARQSEIQNSKAASFDTILNGQEVIAPNPTVTKQQAILENSAQNKSDNTVSESEQREIDRINEQIKELDRINKESKNNYQAPTPANITPLEIKPIVVPDIDTTITTQPIDGTIKPTGRPADVCASSAAKFLPECK